MNSWISFVLIISLAISNILLIRRVLSLKREVSIILEQLSILRVNEKLQKKRIEDQVISLIKVLASNTQLKSRVATLQKEVKALQQLLNN